MFNCFCFQASLPPSEPTAIPVYDDETDEEPDVEDIDVDSKVAIDILTTYVTVVLYLKGKPLKLCE